jgi:hypothetical protein
MYSGHRETSLHYTTESGKIIWKQWKEDDFHNLNFIIDQDAQTLKQCLGGKDHLRIHTNKSLAT